MKRTVAAFLAFALLWKLCPLIVEGQAPTNKDTRALNTIVVLKAMGMFKCSFIFI